MTLKEASPAESLELRARRILQRSGSLVGVIGLLILIGASLKPDLKLDVALGLMLAGAALLASAASARQGQRAASGLAWILLGLGVASLIQDVLGVGLGIDALLASDASEASPTGAPGRMSPASAAAFGLLAIALLGRRRVWVNQLAGGLVALIGAGAIVGYLYGIEPARSGESTSAMSWPASMGFLVAGAGALFAVFAGLAGLAERKSGIAAVFLDESEPGRQLRLFFPIAIILPLALGSLALAGGRIGLWDRAYETVILSLSTIGALVLFAILAYRSFTRSDEHRLTALFALAASEERYRRTFQDATIGIAHLAPDGRWIRVNDRICEILGYSPEELLEKTYGEVSHIDDLEIDVKQWELLRRGEIEDFGVERRFVTKEGEVVFADVRLVREEDERGALQHFIVVLQDITGRKLSEGTLRVYQRALSATQNGIVIADATQDDHPIIYVNPAFLEMTGFDATDLIGHNCRVLNRHARDQAGLKVIRDALAAGEESAVLLRNHRKDDTPFWNQLSIAPVHDDLGRLTHFVGIAIDVTDRVDATAERERLLEGAESANQEKDRFLSVVSHEMRSPMNAILAWASILEDDPQSEEVARAAEAITSSVKSQSRLVDDLLEVSRMRAGTLEIQMAEIDFASTIESVVDQHTPVAREQQIELVWKRPNAAIVGRADPERLAQILRNLIDNALKFTAAGGRVEIALAEEARSVSVAVRDTGQGIAVDALERVFEDFWQGDRKGGSGGKGLGLGLPIVRHLVERQGGTIEAESAGKGSGATFRLRFPRIAPDSDSHRPVSADGAAFAASAKPSRESAVEKTPAPAAGTTEPAPEDALAGLEVVVVDDDVATVDASAAVLSSAGAIVRRAGSVSEALRHFERSVPDILVSDIGLPDRDGMDLIRTVRSLPEPRSAVLALAVTGYADEAERRRIQRAGFDAYLSKPVAPTVILDRVRELWSLEGARDSTHRRVLLVQGSAEDRDDPDLCEMVASIEAEGHDLRRHTDIARLDEVVKAFEPEIIFVSSRLDGVDAAALGERLRAGSVAAVLVAVVEDGDRVELAGFDYLLRRPGPEHALRRMLRTIELSS